jgi:SAM-dependent methyltransferase
MTDASDIQRKYYTETASTYEDQHGNAVEHEAALRLMYALMIQFNMNTVLDVGAGTGRGLSFFLGRGIDVRGVEPVPALIEQAIGRRGIPPERIQCARGESLPFPDRSFDVVCATGVLHHVPDPDRVVREMTRVARRAVFLSDENRFGVGSWPSKLLALSLYRLGLSRLYTSIRTGGKMYIIDKDDGLRYSFSLYETLPTVHRWADTVMILPTKPGKSASCFQPLLTHSHLLMCGMRNS